MRRTGGKDGSDDHDEQQQHDGDHQYDNNHDRRADNDHGRRHAHDGGLHADNGPWRSDCALQRRHL